jgi:hypothetical protein
MSAWTRQGTRFLRVFGGIVALRVSAGYDCHPSDVRGKPS